MKRLISASAFLILIVVIAAIAAYALNGSSATDTTVAPKILSGLTSSTAMTAYSPSSEPRYNTISMVLDSGIDSASALKTYIEEKTTTSVIQALKWDASAGVSGAFLVYEPGNPFSNDFTIDIGDPLFMLLSGSAPDTLSFVGGVPPQKSVSFELTGNADDCHYNFISVPLDKGEINDAAGLATDVGDVSQILSWNASAGDGGAYLVYEPGNPLSDNFPVRIGYPYFVCMTVSKIWPDW